MRSDKTLAFVFPGQGSQSVGMLSEFTAPGTAIEETFAAASMILGFDLWKMVQQGPESALDKTVNTQPALLSAGVAIWRLWCEAGGVIPGILAGHSLGEYTALVCAGSLKFEEAVGLVADRGRFMQEAVPDRAGAMAAILGLSDAQVEAACMEAAGDEVVAPANYNAPGQVVISGHRNAVQRAMQRAREAGAKRTLLLSVSVPSHCALMAPAARRLARRLASAHITDAGIGVVQNVDAVERTHAASIQVALVRQLHCPVRWVDCVRGLRTRGVTRVIECGPGRVLSGLIRRIDGEMEIGALCDPAGLREALDGIIA
ncbi:MAG: ACP S-malonyltransferase [Gammaproteobacteria bacterium]